MGTAFLASMAILQATGGVTQMIEGRTAEIKAETQADILATEKSKQAKKLLGRQTMSFLKSGVGLGGTPQTVFQETIEFAKEDISNIRSYYKDIGRQAKIKGFTQGLSNIAQAGFTAHSAFKPKTTTDFGSLNTPASANTFDPSLNISTDFNNFNRV